MTCAVRPRYRDADRLWRPPIHYGQVEGSGRHAFDSSFIRKTGGRLTACGQHTITAAQSRLACHPRASAPACDHPFNLIIYYTTLPQSEVRTAGGSLQIDACESRSSFAGRVFGHGALPSISLSLSLSPTELMNLIINTNTPQGSSRWELARRWMRCCI